MIFESRVPTYMNYEFVWIKDNIIFADGTNRQYSSEFDNYESVNMINKKKGLIGNHSAVQ